LRWVGVGKGAFGAMLKRPSHQAGWLGAPAGVVASDIDASSNNPFIRYRRFLWSYHAAAKKGCSDADFTQLVQRLDAAVAEVDSKGFEVTPFKNLSALAREVGIGQLAAKDESHNVAGSHKARHLFGLALHLEVQQVSYSQPLAIASCGNAALGAAVVARALQRPLDVFAPVHADETILGELDRLGAHVHLCDRLPNESGDPSFLRFKEAISAGALAFSVQGTENIFALDGGRCLGWELAESFAGDKVEGTGFASESLFIQVGGGALASSVIQGLTETYDLGLLRSLPAVFAVQTVGCAPLARALNLVLEKAKELDSAEAALAASQDHPADYMWPWEPEPKSVATGILDDETYDWLPIVWGMLETQGGAPVVSEKTLAQASALATQHSGSRIGPTGAAGLAGVMSLVSTSDAGQAKSCAGQAKDDNSVLAGSELPAGATVLLTGRT